MSDVVRDLEALVFMSVRHVFWAPDSVIAVGYAPVGCYCHDIAARIKHETDDCACQSLRVAELPNGDVSGMGTNAWPVSQSNACSQVARDSDS